MIVPSLFMTLALALPPTKKSKLLQELKSFTESVEGYEFYLTYEETPDKKEGWQMTPFVYKDYRLWARKTA